MAVLFSHSFAFRLTEKVNTFSFVHIANTSHDKQCKQREEKQPAEGIIFTDTTKSHKRG
jgi:hypothetical protein